MSKPHLRGKIFSSLANSGLNMKARDTFYRVLTDSPPSAPNAAHAKGNQKVYVAYATISEEWTASKPPATWPLHAHTPNKF